MSDVQLRESSRIYRVTLKEKSLTCWKKLSKQSRQVFLSSLTLLEGIGNVFPVPMEEEPNNFYFLDMEIEVAILEVRNLEAVSLALSAFQDFLDYGSNKDFNVGQETLYILQKGSGAEA